MNRKLTITFPYYNNPEMLEEQLKNFNRYCDFKHEVEVVVVDDGSSKPAVDVIRNSPYKSAVPLHLFRIEEDIAWNHGGARNLALTQINEGWVWMTDIDHLVPYKTVKRFFEMAVDPVCVYLPTRQRMISTDHSIDHHVHRDSFILTRDLFWEVGGFDEQFSGYWNGVSRLFRTELKRRAKHVETDLITLLYDQEVIEDSNTPLGRKGTQYDIDSNPPLKRKFNQALKAYKPEQHLQFKWHKEIV